MAAPQSMLTRRHVLALASATAVASRAGAEQYTAAESSRARTRTNQQRTLRERLGEQRPLLGLLQKSSSRVLEELAGECGYDFLMLDGEHGAFSEADFRGTLARLDDAGILAFLRVPELDPRLAKRYLQMGADVIVAPHVSSVADAKAMARATTSHGGSLIVILETRGAVENAADILAVEGVEGGIIGPNDLSTDLGINGQYSHASYTQAFARIERAAAVGNKPLGTIPHGEYSLQALGERGHRLLILASDRSVMRNALRAQIDAAQSVLKLSSKA